MCSFVATVEKWCIEAGAAELNELCDEVENIGEDLSLSQPELCRLRSTLTEWQLLFQSPPLDVQPALQRTRVCGAETLLQEGKGQDIFEDEEDEAEATKQEEGKEQEGENQRQGQRPPGQKLESTEGPHALGQQLYGTGLSERAVPGLRGALAEAGLTGLLERAEAWCFDIGAAILAEIIDELEDLCAVLGLDLAQRATLRAALQVRAGGAGKGAGATRLHRLWSDGPIALVPPPTVAPQRW